MNKLVRESLWYVSLLVGVLTLTGCVMDLNVALTKADLASEVIPTPPAPPVPTIQVSNPSNAYGSSTTSFVYTVTYTNVTTVNLQNSDISLGGTDITGCSANVTNGTTLTPTVTISGCTGDGTVHFSIAAETGEDADGVKTAAFGPSVNFAIAHAFVMTIDTTKGDGLNRMILPIGGWSGVDFVIDWGDGTAPETVKIWDNWNGPGSTLIQHAYAVAGTYDLKIKGAMPVLRFGGIEGVDTDSDGNDDLWDDNEKLKVLDIKQWGINAWSDAEMMFSGCRNIRVSAVDAPDFSAVTKMVNMFSGAIYLNDPMNHWDVSNIEDMRGVFTGAVSFNQPLFKWETHNVTTMASMFGGASAFNQDISNWDTSNVTSMSYMFFEATSYNSPMPTNNEKWDTSKVTDMAAMFGSAPAFNQDISSWNVGSVTTMENMFKTSPGFNQNLSGWNVSNVTNFDYFDQDATAWQNANKPLFVMPGP